MPRDFQLYLDDMISSCKKIIKYTDLMTPDQFFHNNIIYDAVLYNLLIIGEAAKNLPENIRNQYAQVEWKKISGFRDIIAHAYFGIDNSILWEIIHSKIPNLLAKLKTD